MLYLASQPQPMCLSLSRSSSPLPPSSCSTRPATSPPNAGGLHDVSRDARDASEDRSLKIEFQHDRERARGRDSRRRGRSTRRSFRPQATAGAVGSGVPCFCPVLGGCLRH